MKIEIGIKKYIKIIITILNYHFLITSRNSVECKEIMNVISVNCLINSDIICNFREIGARNSKMNNMRGQE